MKGQKGFTLIELMIVVAIIGALTAIAIPAYKSYTKKSEVTSAVATVRSLLTNIDLFEQEKGSFPAVGKLGDVGGSLNMSSLGSVALDATNVTSGGSATFTFGPNSTFTSTEEVQFQKRPSGWTCVHNTGLAVKSCTIGTIL